MQYCHQQNVDPFQATSKMDIVGLAEYFHNRVGYSSVNSATSVLSIKTENETPFGKLPLVCKSLKIVFNLRSVLPFRYIGCISCPKVYKESPNLKAILL